jgi:DNA-binding transcriptional LysR family regulator
MTPKIRDPEVLLAVSRQGSFGKAASELLISQPAVSTRVRDLERAVGRRLVERTNRGATLTAAGEQLAGYAARCLALAEEAIETARGFDDVPRFVIAGHSTFGSRVVPLVFGALTDMPRRLVLKDAHSHEALALVQDGTADLGITINSSVPSGTRRITLPIDPVLCVASPEHPIVRLKSASVTDLKTAVIALNPWGEGADRAVERLTSSTEAWRIRHCADASTAITLARDHHHVAFVTESSAAADVRQGTLRSVRLIGLPRWTVGTQIVYRSNRQHDPAMQAVARAIRSIE